MFPFEKYNVQSWVIEVQPDHVGAHYNLGVALDDMGDRPGAVVQASAERWCDAFEWRGHSNLVCSHVPEFVRALPMKT